MMNKFRFKIDEGEGQLRSVIFKALCLLWTIYKKGFIEVRGANLLLYRKSTCIKDANNYTFVTTSVNWNDDEMKRDILFYFQLCWLRANNPPQCFPYAEFDEAWEMLKVYRANPFSSRPIMRSITEHLDTINKKGG